MKKPLPTIDSNGTKICDFLEALETALEPDCEYKAVRMYFYGVTWSGWATIRNFLKKWEKANSAREIKAYVGTDHALTEPDALEKMKADGVGVFLLTTYAGTYHPKLVVLESDTHLLLISGSNNLTGKGLKSNIEFGSVIKIPKRSRIVYEWETAIASASEALSDKLLKSYARERKKREKALKGSGVKWSFTFKERRKSKGRKQSAILDKLPISLTKGTLIYEVMPKETSVDGSQIQIRKAVATSYFGLKNKVGSKKKITLVNLITKESRRLIMQYFENITMRLSIHEASFSARPCFLVFRKRAPATFDFIVISESENPLEYEAISKRLGAKRTGQRRYEIIS